MSEINFDKSHVDAEMLQTFKLALPDLRKKYGKEWDNYEVESVWIGSIVVGQTFYVVHVKQGHLPLHHNYTIKFEINHGKFIMHEVHEGYLSIF